jgi:hypothetical protein
MRKLFMVGAMTFHLSGCSSLAGPGENIGWTDAIPPVGNGVGRLVEKNRGYKSLGAAAFTVNPDQVEVLETYEMATSSEETKFRARTEAVFAKITAAAGLEHASANLNISSGWRVIQLRDFSTAVIDKEFAYKCLTAQAFSYEASRANNAGASVDATEVAKVFGVTAAAVDVNASTGEHTKITIANPNVCLSIVSAKWVRDRWWWSRSDKPIAFKRGQETQFELVVDKPGAKAVPDFGRRAKATKPSYQLAAGSNNGQAILKVLIENNEIDQEIPAKILKENYPGVWSRRFPVHTFHIEDDIYAVMSVQVVAKRTDDNTIVVESAELTSPEYRLIRN